MPLFICRQRQELLALSAYLGALLAIRRKYTPIIHPLFKHARCGDKTLLNCFPLLCKRFFLPASEKQAEWENNFFLKLSHYFCDNPRGSKRNFTFTLHKLSISHIRSASYWFYMGYHSNQRKFVWMNYLLTYMTVTLPTEFLVRCKEV